MRLVKFKDGAGRDVWVNADLVTAVAVGSTYPDDLGDTWLEGTAVSVVGGSAVAIVETLEAVVSKLEASAHEQPERLV